MIPVGDADTKTSITTGAGHAVNKSRSIKNLIDLNLHLTQQILPIRSQSGKTVQTSGTKQHESSSPQKFLEDIIANGKRCCSSTSTTSERNSSIGIGGGLVGSHQLATNVTIINRYSEERSLFSEKLILERYRNKLKYIKIISIFFYFIFVLFI